MEKLKIYAVQGFLAAVTASFTAKMDVLFWVLILFIAAMVVDFLSGMAASAKEAIDNSEDTTKGWSSKKGTLGIIKKFGYILVVAVAIAVDLLIYKVAGYLNFNMPGTTFFGLLVTVWFILNELLSIVENAGRMGVINIPTFLTKAIRVLKNKVDTEGGEDDGED